MTTFKQIDEFIQTLPVSFYTKSKQDIRARLDEKAESTYVRLTDYGYEICVSYTMLSKFGHKLSECQVRTLFYHEISHILDDTFGKWSAVSVYTNGSKYLVPFNIASDERIEFIYKDYFHNVDFDKTKRELIKIDYNDKNILNHFLWYVRLGYNREVYGEHCERLLKSFIKSGTIHSFIPLYHEFKNKFDIKFDEIMNRKPEMTDSETDDSETTDSTISRYDDITLLCVDDKYFTKDEFIEMSLRVFNDIIGVYADNLQDISDALEISIKKNKNKFASMSAYSGVFNTRALTKDDYRWWCTPNRNGQYKHHNKIHIKFLIDNSGSFLNNVEQTNRLIKILNTLENRYPMFKYSFATINTQLEVWSEEDKTKKVFTVNGGNDIPVNKVRKYLDAKDDADAEYYTIIMFDGDALTDYNRHFNMSMPKDSVFKIFDRVNTSIITEFSNKKYTTQFEFADVIIEDNNYVDKIIENTKKIMIKFLNA